MLIPRIEVTIQPNQVTAQILASGQVASGEGPFSCDHLLADEVDILEHVCHGVLKRVTGGGWTFPRVTVSTAGRPIHIVERKVIRDSLLNAGASQVELDTSVRVLDEQSAARSTYVERAKRRK